MTVRSTLVADASQRLLDTSNTIFPVAEMRTYFNGAVTSIYPTFFNYETSTTTATNGPIQTMPTLDGLGNALALPCRNLYYIGESKSTSVRVRLLRQWKEGVGCAFIPKTGIAGETLVWAWTSGFTDPGDDVTALNLTPEAEDVVVIKMCIAALERVASSRVELLKYFALTVREGVTEQDVIQALDAFHASLDDRIKAAIPRPARVG